MTDLKEKLVSQHLVFDKNDNQSNVLNKMRETALDTFEKQGFPNVKMEEWKYTNLKSILNKDYKIIPHSENTLEYRDVKQYLLHDLDSYKIVFVDGVYSGFLSKTTHEEADICVISSAFSKGVHLPVVENFYNKQADNSQSLVALNTAYAKDGAYIYIPDGTILSRPIQILYFSTSAENMIYHPRNLIVLGDRSHAQIIERHQTINGVDNLTNCVSEIFVGKNAHLDYYKIQNDTKEASLIDQTFVQQERDSVASVHTFSLGGKIIRNELNFAQNGENCNSILKGITLGEGEQLIDHHTRLEHKSPHCESHELYRTILDGKAKGVFNGKVIVDADAQKIDAFQQNNNILLKDTASIDTKPQLEIFADDVKCSHGCTVGQLDEDAMFYLQTRGIPKKEARALLLNAFSADVLETVKIQQLKTKVNKWIADKLGVNLEFEL